MNNSNENVQRYSSGGRIMGNPGANEVSAEEQMETIPFNNFMSERETGEFGISE